MFAPIESSSRLLVCLTFPADPYVDNFEIAETEQHALAQAQHIAKSTGAGMDLLYVRERMYESLADRVAEFEGDHLRRTREAMKAIQQKCIAAGTDTEIHFANGMAWFEIIKHATALNSGMIVVSARRDKSTRKDGIVLGSTARKIVRKSHVPVWVDKGTRTEPVVHVMAAIDLSDASGRVLEAADWAASTYVAKKSILHCPDYSGEIIFTRMPDAMARKDEYRSEVTMSAVNSIRELTDDDSSWNLVVDPRRPAKAIPEVTEEEDVDLVVLNSVSRTGIAGFIIGNTAEKILHAIPASMLVLKPEGWSSPVS